MSRFVLSFRRIMLTGFVLTFAAALPIGMVPRALAAPCTPPPDPGPGVHHPVGADAATFSYNCSTGLWENQYYTYDPATSTYSPAQPVTYTYNPATGQYDYITWVFNAPTGTYKSVTKSVKQPPTGATVVGAPAALSSPAPGSESISNTGDNSNNSIDSNLGGTGSINGTGASSTNGITGTGNNTTTLNNGTVAGVNNIITGTATTGDALVLANTVAGDAASGNAQDLANVVNLLQSSTNALGGDTTTFVANIDGDVNGDFLINPAGLGTVQPASATANPGNNNLTVNNQTAAAINNDITLDAESGDATVDSNTKAGDAKTGNAQAVADVVNLIDSAITSGHSFVGVININGNLNGNIVVPPELVNQLIASNVPTVSIDMTGSGSTNTITNHGGSQTTVTNTNNQGITNNVNAAATSGNATETENTKGGNATTGTANTHITAFNLTGSQVVGANDLLVFVNVLGKWVGMIINAPPGATAAEFGGGITSTSNPIGTNTTNVDNVNNQQINNNINVRAGSGDATVSDNTEAGDATSGNADAAVNLLNVEDSSMSLSGWFGILFINVFGNWHGNFGVYQPTIVGGKGGAHSNSPTSSGPPPVFRFIPRSSAVNNGATTSSVLLASPDGSVLAAHISRTPTLSAPAHSHQGQVDALIATLVVLSILADTFRSYRHTRRAKTTV
ncbi:MAG TPA: hypothetical protein VG992_02615 [Candidatus Saccharimonadales bacterium]|nr:hypothetical protein [Candidatus Saccharimonadales bacterium]